MAWRALSQHNPPELAYFLGSVTHYSRVVAMQCSYLIAKCNPSRRLFARLSSLLRRHTTGSSVSQSLDYVSMMAQEHGYSLEVVYLNRQGASFGVCSPTVPGARGPERLRALALTPARSARRTSRGPPRSLGCRLRRDRMHTDVDSLLQFGVNSMPPGVLKHVTGPNGATDAGMARLKDLVTTPLN
jgi:hypothetical protein